MIGADPSGSEMLLVMAAALLIAVIFVLLLGRRTGAASFAPAVAAGR
jgi:hypothetical protein